VIKLPIKKCQKGGKPGYKWGDSGVCITYNTNDEASRKRARLKVLEIARAIFASGGKK